MRLRTLGGLALEGTDFNRTKPLLLLTYLTVEGPKERRFLAELFWPGAADHLNSLARALSHLRHDDKNLIRVDGTKVSSLVASDVTELLESLDQGNGERAAGLYSGPFLEGFYLRQLGEELEEWVFGTREVLATRLRAALLDLAEELAVSDPAAARYAERAFDLEAAAAPEPDILRRLFELLKPHSSPYLNRIRKEAEAYDLTLGGRTPTLYEPPNRRHNLKTSASTFVGRDLELTELGEMLGRADCRLITLLGPGGAGKTRLAEQLAHDQAATHRFSDGVYFAELETVSETDAVPAKLAEVFGIGLQGEATPTEQIRSWCKDKCCLVVLDNFEHLLAASPFVADLLENSSDLKLIVTSRTKLGLEGEWQFVLGGLHYPRSGQGSTWLGDFEAVDLFVERALLSDRNFSLTPENAPCVVKICTLTAGLPLALELAASWVGVIPLADIASDLAAGLNVLATETPKKTERHMSIEATFEYSWRLLSPGEQAVLSRLSVFRGSFTRGAAAEVAGSSVPVLTALVAKSWVQLAATKRYDVHPLMQQYLRDKLARDPQAQAEARARHAAHYFALLERFGKARHGPDERELLDAIGTDLDNCLAAWRWAVAERRLDYLLQADTLCVYFDKRVRCHEGIEAFGLAVAALDETEGEHRPVLGALWHRQAKLYLVLRRSHQAKALAERSVEILRSLDADDALAKALTILGAAEKSLGEYHEANLHFQAALTLTGKTPGADKNASYLFNLARAERALGNVVEAERLLSKVLGLRQASGDTFGEVMALNQLGILSDITGAFTLAESYWLEGLTLARATDYESRIPFLVYHLAGCQLRRGALELAHEAALELAATTTTHADPTVAMMALCLTGRVACFQGEYLVARYKLGQSLSRAWREQALSRVLESLVYIAQWHALQDDTPSALTLLNALEPYLAMDSHVKSKAQRLFAQISGGARQDYGELAMRTEPGALETLVDEYLAEAVLARASDAASAERAWQVPTVFGS